MYYYICIFLFYRSAHSNAYLYGFWKNKRIVLFDTLIQDDLISTEAQKADTVQNQAQEALKETIHESGMSGVQYNEDGVVETEGSKVKAEQKPEQKVSSNCHS